MSALDEALNIVPSGVKTLRACMACGLIKTRAQFLEDGCDNCPLAMHRDPDTVEASTSASFEGMVAITQPNKSWVARWQSLRNTAKPGCYAVVVHGRLNEELVQSLAENNITYHPLDQAS